MSDANTPGSGMGSNPVSPGDPGQRSAPGTDPREGAGRSSRAATGGRGTAPGAVTGYAEAIVNVARAEGVAERVEDELFQVARTFEANDDLRERLTDPQLDPGTKLGVITELLQGRAHPQTVSAVLWVVQAGRARQLADIADAVVRLGAESRNRVVAEVRTAVALDRTQQQRLAQALSQTTGQEIEPRVVVDPDVVGGVVVTIGDTVIDGSVARRLTEFRSRLTGA
jgi:F-type H+-transporting ATPase subunit delta